MLVPNYEEMLEPFLDSELGKLHKLEYSIHQWRFEAVKPDIYFPTGCKIVYKHFSSNRFTSYTKEITVIKLE